MKNLGIRQFHQKKFKILDISNSGFEGLLGDITEAFVLTIGGYSGNGKTEGCMQFADFLCTKGKVLWLSYEQRHGYDLQKSTFRNDMEKHSSRFIVSDPMADLDKGVSLFEDLYNYLGKRNSADYVFIDSFDYTGFTWEQYKILKETYGHKKGLILIMHTSKSGIFKKRVCEQVAFDGGSIFIVRDYIIFPEKNRYGGVESYVVWEQEARKRNPLFFEKRLKETPEKPKPKRGESTQLTIETHEELPTSDTEQK